MNIQPRFEYKDGEWDAFTFAFRNPEAPKFLCKCRRGHMIESPIPLEQDEADGRCLTCAEKGLPLIKGVING